MWLSKNLIWKREEWQTHTIENFSDLADRIFQSKPMLPGSQLFWAITLPRQLLVAMSRNTKPTLELVFKVIAPYIVAFPTYRGVLSDQLFNIIFVHKRECDLSIFRQFFFRVFPSGGSARRVAPTQPDQGKFDVSKCSFFFMVFTFGAEPAITGARMAQPV